MNTCNILLFILAADVPPPYYGQPAPAPAPAHYPQQQVIIYAWLYLNNHCNEQFLEHNPMLGLKTAILKSARCM